VQEAVQFEIYHFWIFGQKAHGAPKGVTNKLLAWLGHLPPFFSKWADRKLLSRVDYREAPEFKGQLSHKSWFNACKKALGEYDAWFKTSNNQYDVNNCPSIIITDAPIEGGYISFANEDIGLISTAKWKHFFRPVSALDYLLFSVQRLTMRLAFTKEIGSHYPTRGCIWDYDDHQPDARIAILLGYICQTCENKLLTSVERETYADILKLVDNRWLGDKSVQFSPSAILSKVYKYDLSRSTGLNVSAFSKVVDAFISELGKVLSEALKWTLVLIASLTLAAYFPNVLAKIKQQLSMNSAPSADSPFKVNGIKDDRTISHSDAQPSTSNRSQSTSHPGAPMKPATAPPPPSSAASTKK
jgi:hypothetical protein